MKKLGESLEQYIRLRRNLGAKLRGVDSTLRSFVAFAEREHAPYITSDLAVRWAREPHMSQPATWGSRLQMVRGFAIWLKGEGCTNRSASRWSALRPLHRKSALYL